MPSPLPLLSPRTFVFLTVLFTAWTVGCGSALSVDFTAEIRPLLSNRCFACHGPDENQRAAGLRLDTADGAFEDLGGYAAVVPGSADDSELLTRIESDDPDIRMPPPEHGDQFSPTEIETLRRWIDDGAAFESHWAYQAPMPSAVPEVDRDFQARSPIDCFVADKLTELGWSDADEADRTALSRRVSLDLIGLPPTWEQTQRFVNDKHPNAYLRFVDHVMSDPAFGERWARVWLDLARYADSAGYADDPERTIWAFRDYVIDSFNASKPFDEFTREQIAGDLLPSTGDHSVDQQRLIATAFHRNTMTNNEGGTSNEEFRNEAVVDRTNTTFAVWMGTTMACAQCHTHKFDPIKHEEYFQIHAFFNNTADNDLKDESPTIEIFSDSQRTKRNRLRSRVTTAKDNLRASFPKQSDAIELGFGVSASNLPAEALATVDAKSSSRELMVEESGEVTTEERPDQATDVLTLKVPSEFDQPIRLLRLAVLPEQRNNFVLTKLTVAVADDDVESGFRLLSIDSFGVDYAQKAFGAPGAFDAPDRDESGWAIGGQTGKPHWLTVVLSEPISPGETIQVVLAQQHLKHKRHVLQAYRIDAITGDSAQFLLGMDRIDRLERQLAAIRPVTTVPVMEETGSKSRRKTFVQIRGNYQATADEVRPGTPKALHRLNAVDDGDPNRLDLANWLVDRSNPLTARVIANRHWEQLFGIGIVATSEEFGSQGELPTHPELLDYLALELQNSDWDLKRLLREIVTSHSYRQSSRVNSETMTRDPANRFLARGPRHRISAEMVRDQALASAGLLCRDMHGPPVKPPQPNLGLKAAFGATTDWTTSEGGDRYRRGLYTMWRRSSPYPSIAAFDAPNREVCLVKRDRTNTPLQALVTLNDPVYVEAAQSLARHVIRAVPTDLDRVDVAFHRVLLRDPTHAEVDRVINLLQKLRHDYANDIEGARQMAENPIGPLNRESVSFNEGEDVDTTIIEHAAWTVVANVLLNLDEVFMKR